MYIFYTPYSHHKCLVFVCRLFVQSTPVEATSSTPSPSPSSTPVPEAGPSISGPSICKKRKRLTLGGIKQEVLALGDKPSVEALEAFYSRLFSVINGSRDTLSQTQVYIYIYKNSRIKIHLYLYIYLYTYLYIG